jgi:CheY-like chemotaxis protein
MLTRMGCEMGQGFGIARPMSAGDFEAWLPAPVSIVDHRHADESTSTPAVPRVADTTILLVDDRLDTLELGSLDLRRHGYRTKIALSGEEALHLASADRPGLILMDLDMPGRDGFQVAAAFRSDADLATVPIAAWTDLPVARFQTGGHNPFDGTMGKTVAPGTASFGARVEHFLAGHDAN